MFNNGLKAFGIHSLNEDSRPRVSTLQNEIEADAKSAGLPFDPSVSDSETVARRYLKQATASEAIPDFTIREDVQDETEFRTLGTETLQRSRGR